MPLLQKDCERRVFCKNAAAIYIGQSEFATANLYLLSNQLIDTHQWLNREYRIIKCHAIILSVNKYSLPLLMVSIIFFRECFQLHYSCPKLQSNRQVDIFSSSNLSVQNITSLQFPFSLALKRAQCINPSCLLHMLLLQTLQLQPQPAAERSLFSSTLFFLS